MGSKKTKTAVICLTMAVILIAGGIFVYYYTQFSLVLNGEKEVTLNLCQVYEDPGVSAKRGGKDAGREVRTDSDLDTGKPGNYTIVYSLGNLSVSRHVTVGGTMDPVLKLKGRKQVDIKLGEKYVDSGFKAFDGTGKSLTGRVKVQTPKITKTGRAYIKYTVTDQQGKSTLVTRALNVLPNTAYDTPGLPICMFHYVYDRNDPPEDLLRRYGNYIEMRDLEEELRWLKSEDYYFPTWREVRDYIDGKLLLPDRSIVLCFDDGARSFLELGIPVLERCKVPATSFMITSGDGAKKVKKFQSKYVTYESHSHNMHRAGGNIGHGGIFTAMPEEKALEDLKTSVAICKNGDAFAYPFGDYTPRCRDIVENAGFQCAVTTQAGKARPGMDPLLLPRVRMVMGQSLQRFESVVAPPGSIQAGYSR